MCEAGSPIGPEFDIIGFDLWAINLKSEPFVVSLESRRHRDYTIWSKRKIGTVICDFTIWFSSAKFFQFTNL